MVLVYRYFDEMEADQSSTNLSTLMKRKVCAGWEVSQAAIRQNESSHLRLPSTIEFLIVLACTVNH